MALDLKSKLMSMDKKKLGLIVLAIVAALIAVVLTNNYIETNSNERAKALAGGLTEAAKKELAENIERNIVEKLNQDIVPRMNSLQTQMATQATATQQRPQQQSLSVKTPVGKRAITVVVDRIFAVGGFVSPGDYVDIITHLSAPANPNDPKGAQGITVTLFQNVLVLAVGNNMQPGTGYEAQQNATSIPITFALNPQEANLLSFVQQHGNLQLALRPSLDTQAYMLPAATWDALSDYIRATNGIDAGLPRQPGPESSVESKPPIEIFRGGQQ